MVLSELDLYRHLHRGNEGDVQFYRRVAEEAKSVLELGCGWGRVTEALLSRGREVVGLEAEEAFVALARGRLPGTTFVKSDMRSFELGRKFDLVIIPYNAVYCLGGEEGLRRCLRQAERHLVPEGELWLDCYPVDDFHEAALSSEIPPDDDEPIAHLGTPQGDLPILEKTELHPREQRLEVTYEVRSKAGAMLLQSRLTHHYLLQSQLLSAAEDCGLALGLLAGGFAGERADLDPLQLVFGWTKPS